MADVVARDTVRALEDFRFLEAGGGTAQGVASAFGGLAAGTAQALLIHDDPQDLSLASFGARPNEVSPQADHYPNHARRADVAIWSAVCQGIAIRVIPGTGTRGPDENIGVTINRIVPANDGQ